jgi:hypothetical protein
VAKAPCRLRLSSERANLLASKSAMDGINHIPLSHCNMSLFRAKPVPTWTRKPWFVGSFTELGHTSAQLALLVDRYEAPFMRRIAG